MKVLILSGPNHGFDKCAAFIDAFLSEAAHLEVRLEGDHDILASAQMDEFDVCVFGIGFTRSVHIEDGEHEVTQGLADFEVEDEIYMSAWDPDMRILATAEWAERSHPVAWVKQHGGGRVSYTVLGHGPGTFEAPGMQACSPGGCAGQDHRRALRTNLHSIYPPAPAVALAAQIPIFPL